MSKFKETYLIEANKWSFLVQDLSKEYGLPEISSSLGVYFNHEDSNFELKFLNSNCYFKTHNKESNLDKNIIKLFKESPQIEITNKNIKFFLRSLSTLGLNEAHVSNKVTNIRLKNGIDINLNTPIGDLLTVKNPKIKKSVFNKFVSEKLSSDEVDTLFKNKIKADKVFDDLGILNSKIVEYSNEFGIDLTSSGRSTTEDRLKIKSNDYSDHETVYEAIIGDKINNGSSKDGVLKKFFKPLSIVVSSYNSNETILDLLHSIESQNLSLKQKRSLDVIVVDDGSTVPVFAIVKNDKFSFDLNIVRLEKNKGLSNARNLGVTVARYKKILFIDSDILLSENYLLEHSVALQMFPDAIFVSMKRNIEPDSDTRKKVNEGLPVPENFDDKRLVRAFEKKQSWINEVKDDGVYEVVSETNNFKSFGYKKLVGGYDLPSMVVGHNMSLDKSMILTAGGFSNYFIGWGLEDAYFGAKLISSGAFVIPILKTGVYHINHPPRSGNKKRQMEEYKENLKQYNKLIEEEI